MRPQFITRKEERWFRVGIWDGFTRPMCNKYLCHPSGLINGDLKTLEWSERKKKRIFIDVEKYALCFPPPALRGKVGNLIKAFSGGAALITDSLNKQRVPSEHKIYMLQHVLSLHLDFGKKKSEWLYWKQLNHFSFSPRQHSPLRRSVKMHRTECQPYFQ